MTLTVLCATTNDHKFGIGQSVLSEYDISLVQRLVEIDEIQGENAELIVRDKAAKAYAALLEPVIVTDTIWEIAALGGFPGAYMKSINHWFEPQDFIDLMSHKTDRRVVVHEYLAYCDGNQTVVFNGSIPGVISDRPHGTYGPPIMHVVVLDADSGRTISEIYDQGLEHNLSRLADRGDAWRKLADWLKEHAA